MHKGRVVELIFMQQDLVDSASVTADLPSCDRGLVPTTMPVAKASNVGIKLSKRRFCMSLQKLAEVIRQGALSNLLNHQD